MNNDILNEKLDDLTATHPDLLEYGAREKLLTYMLDRGVLDMETAYQQMNGGIKSTDDMFGAIDRVLDRQTVDDTSPSRLSFAVDEDGNTLNRDQQNERFNKALDYALKTEAEDKDLASVHNDANRPKMKKFHNDIDAILDRDTEPKTEAVHKAPEIEQLGAE